MTHGEKDKLIEELKEQLKAAKELIVRKKSADANMHNVGFSIIKKGNVFNLVAIKFNVDDRCAEVESTTELGGDYAIALYKAKQFLVEKVLKDL